ncbi:Nitrogen fixation transcriptional regulator protein, NifA, partial CDS, partial [Neorhizobium galegae bv. orientalis]
AVRQHGIILNEL